MPPVSKRLICVVAESPTREFAQGSLPGAVGPSTVEHHRARDGANRQVACRESRVLLQNHVFNLVAAGLRVCVHLMPFY